MADRLRASVFEMRRIILSRKGPSPVLPDGRMLSLPSPDRPGGRCSCYGDLL
jgi:hypothetical protein